MVFGIITGIINLKNKIKIPIEMRFKNIPVLAISLTLMCPLAKTIALGGVAIGNIKAQLEAMDIGIKI